MNSFQGQRIRTQQPILPLDALRFLLSDAFEPGQEPTLIKVLQGDRRIELDDDEIASVIADSKNEGLGAAMTFDRLLLAGQGVESQSFSKNRPK